MKKKIRAFACLFLAAVMTFLCTGCGDKEENTETETKSEYTAEIVVKGYGTITLTLMHDVAPLTVEHFIKLAKEGSYDGAQFNRVQAGFVLQGGVNAKDSSTVKGEFAVNGVSNTLSHTKGVISMARSSDYDSASSQFFIVLDDSAKTSLDGQYAGFGMVTDGWDVVEAICNGVTDSDFSDDYYGMAMGFLKESSYITIETVKIDGE